MRARIAGSKGRKPTASNGRLARSLRRWREEKIAKRHEAAGSRSAVTVADGQVVQRGAEVCRCPSASVRVGASVHMIQDRGRAAKLPWTKGQTEGVDIAKWNFRKVYAYHALDDLSEWLQFPWQFLRISRRLYTKQRKALKSARNRLG